jgi:hypothetical protein
LYHDIVPFVSSSSIYVCCWGKNGNKNLHSQSFLKQDWRCLWSCISKRFLRIVVRISGFPQNSWHISTQPNKSCWYEWVYAAISIWYSCNGQLVPRFAVDLVVCLKKKRIGPMF